MSEFKIGDILEITNGGLIGYKKDCMVVGISYSDGNYPLEYKIKILDDPTAQIYIHISSNLNKSKSIIRNEKLGIL